MICIKVGDFSDFSLSRSIAHHLEDSIMKVAENVEIFASAPHDEVTLTSGLNVELEGSPVLGGPANIHSPS